MAWRRMSCSAANRVLGVGQFWRTQTDRFWSAPKVAAFDGEAERLLIHIGDHENPAGFVVLDDRGDEAIGFGEIATASILGWIPTSS